MLKLTDKEFDLIRNFTKVNYGINLDKKKIFVETRLSIMLKDKGYKNFNQYINMLINTENSAEITDFINKITTNHTFFLRESNHFRYFKDVILPQLEKTVVDRDIRIWSAGCSSGQEAYTIAMVINDYFANKKKNWDTTLLASDISVDMLKKGRRGIYSLSEISSIPKNWINQYFEVLPNGQYKVCDKIRKEVVFKKINLIEPFSFEKFFHIIFCRNVMIYYDEQTKIKLLNRFYDITKDRGYLFIGNSENINRKESRYQFVQQSIYRKE